VTLVVSDSSPLIALSQIRKSHRAGFEYNSKGLVTKAIDPVGRETRYTYGINNTPDPDPAIGTGLDLLKVEQKNGAN
jgi:uncharacterized protein RhaS with RHS repeats